MTGARGSNPVTTILVGGPGPMEVSLSYLYSFKEYGATLYRVFRRLAAPFV